MDEVLTIVESIPPGKVMSYGAIADLLAERSGRSSARLVGTIMARYGGAVPWYRVVNAAGRSAPGHEIEGRELLLAEGVIFRGDRVDMAACSWFPPEESLRAGQ